MRKAISILSMIAALFVVSACATTDSSNEKSNYKMVDVATAKALHERNALFIDVRTRTWFDEGHIPGAINIPFSNFNDNSLAKAASKDQEVYYFMQGYPSCEGAGYSVEQ